MNSDRCRDLTDEGESDVLFDASLIEPGDAVSGAVVLRLGRRGAAGGHADEEWVLDLFGWRWEAWRERTAQEQQERQTYPVRVEGSMA